MASEAISWALLWSSFTYEKKQRSPQRTFSLFVRSDEATKSRKDTCRDSVVSVAENSTVSFMQVSQKPQSNFICLSDYIWPHYFHATSVASLLKYRMVRRLDSIIS